MKNLFTKLSALVIIVVLNTFFVFSQDAWHPPYFDGEDSHVYLNGADGQPNAQTWVDNDFSIDMWIKCDFNSATAGNNEIFTLFGAGQENSSDGAGSVKAYIVYFLKKSTYSVNYGMLGNSNDTTWQHKWHLRVDYRTDDIQYTTQFSSAEKTYTIEEFDDIFAHKWVHMHIRHDYQSDKWARNTSVWVNASKVISEKVMRFDKMDHWHVVLGGHDADPSEDFKGYISGFRLWKDTLLSTPATEYIRDRTFNGPGSFHDDFRTLASKFLLNTYCDGTQIKCTKGDKQIEQFGLIWDNNEEHPAAPPSPGEPNEDIQVSYRDHIHINWNMYADLLEHFGYKIQRKRSTSESWQYVAILQQSDYDDYDPVIFDGSAWDYKIEGIWWTDTPPGYRIAPGKRYLNGLKPVIYDAPTGLYTSDDNCNGDIEVTWNSYTVTGYEVAPKSYALEYKIDGGDWQVLIANIDINFTIYTHHVPPDDLSKEIRYRLDVNDDKVTNYSNEAIGIANSACIDAPTDVIGTVDGENIVVSWNFDTSNPTGGPATAFEIYRTVGDAGSFDLLETSLNVNQLSYIDASALSCINYAYKVRAYNQCNAPGSTGSLSPGSNTVYRTMNFDNVFTYISGGKEYADFDASKGYYNQKVLFEWSVNPDKIPDIILFDIFRKHQGQEYTLLTSIENPNATSYEDQSTEANEFYEYLIRAVSECNDIAVYSDSLSCVGFRAGFGIVSGKVTYQGGNAVENVEVRVSSDDPASKSSLLFNGNYLSTNNFTDESIFHKPFSFDAWVKPKLMTSGDKNVIFGVANGLFNISLVNMRPIVEIGNYQMGCTGRVAIASNFIDSVLTADTWYHIAVNLDPVTGKLDIYLNGESLGSIDFENPGLMQIPWVPEDTQNPGCGPDFANVDIYIGIGDISDPGTSFKGNIDEIRVWQKSRTPEEISRDYTRILTGREEGLIGYYHLDENLGTGIYDISKTGDNYNKNDIVANNPALEAAFPVWSNETPSFNQLHPSGVTDRNGNYLVRGIQYTGSGSLINVTPFLGVHEFNPTDINLYISDGNPVHNNINFIDQSAFDFEGTAYYKGTNVPVEGAGIYVDNVQQFDAGGHPVETNQYGRITVSVPIGEHYVSLKKENHTFENNGQWPAPTEALPYKTFNFQDNTYGITFYDTTQVIVTGRFVGDDVEGNKKPGMGLSYANIGKGKIVFSNEQGYDINIDTEEENSMMQIFTDPETGEYTINMLPIVYKIETVDNEHYEIDQLDLGLLDLGTVPDLITLTDTVFSEDNPSVINEIKEFSYHIKCNFIYYEEPTITVTGINEELFIGEKEYYVENPDTEVIDTIDLINNSPFNYPVFIMGKQYVIDIKVQTVYANYDGNEPVHSIVPIEGAEVSITNNLEVYEPHFTLKTDENGKLSNYTFFRAGFPNMNKNEPNKTSFTKTISITAETGNFNVAWNNGNVFRGYLLGLVDSEGANFVTYGPEVPRFILRDPPGDLSYTTLEQGSSFSAKTSFSLDWGSSTEYDNSLGLGLHQRYGGGLAGPMFSVDTYNNYNFGVSKEISCNQNGAYVETYSFNQSFSTSSSPKAVGSMADVYIGESTNMYFTETNNLRIYAQSYCENSGLNYLGTEEMALGDWDYTIGIKPGFAVSGDTANTMFVYTQQHILHNLIPNYREIIFNLLATDKYISQLDADNPYYGMPNDSLIFPDTYFDTDSFPSYIFYGTGIEAEDFDSIAFLNQQISLWLGAIAFNEAAKVKSKNQFELVENISFDGLAGAYSNSITRTASESEQNSYTCKFSFYVGRKVGFTFNKTGSTMVSKTAVNVSSVLGESSSETREMRWSYVIDDSNQNDYYSIEVLHNNLNVTKANYDEFIELDNFDHVVEGIEGGDLAFSALMQLASAWSPFVAQVVGSVETVTSAAALLGTMAYYRDEIEDETVRFGLHGASPIFKITGGQSRCPYEGEEYTMFHINPNNYKPYPIHVGTQQHEMPKIEIEPSSVINVPAGGTAVFDLRLMNESPTGANLAYVLYLSESSNPNGAAVKIDGLSPNGRSFFISAGQTLNKTLTVQQSDQGIMDYENLKLYLCSACQCDFEDYLPDIYDTTTFTVHFIPTCTEANFVNISPNWVVNKYNNNIMPVTVSGYDINHESFQKVFFQYQQQGTTPTTAMVLYNDTIDTDWASFTGDKIYIDGQAEITFDWNTSALNDGDYTLILTTQCSDLSTFESDHIPGIIDRITPRLFGTPDPADGILSFGEDISILFNEPINSGELYNFGQYGSKSYVTLRGITNGTDLIDSPTLLHDASVHFDGANDYMEVEYVNMDHSDFTFEFWAKRQALGEQTLISINDLKIGFNQSDHFVIEIDGQTMVSNDAYAVLDLWAFYAIAYTRGSEEEGTEPGFTLTILTVSSGTPQVQEVDIISSLQGTMHIGSVFNGNIHEFRIWNYARLSTESAAQKGQILNGYEQGLYSLWPMNDCYGNIAKDIAFGRNAQLNATWQVSRDGKAASFDGSNYFTAPAGSMAFSDQGDFTIEFWFKTPVPALNETMLSNGNPDMESNINAWNITATPDNLFVINNNGTDVIIDAGNYLDDNWHHFAMSLNRIGYLSIYFDGELIKTTSVAPFAGFGAAQIVAGARWYNISGQNHYDQYLAGVIDEIRVWNAARTQGQLQRYMNHTLTGNEMGLKAYFPFEDVTIEDPSESNESANNFTTDTIAVAGDGTLGTGYFTSESPNMKLQRPEVLIPHEIVINNDKVIINTNIDDARIENQILDISIKKVKDLHNNELESTVTWTAFIDRNNVVWVKQKLTIEKYIEESTVVTVNIKNNGGINENYHITNVPSWMEVSPVSGVLAPLGTEEIKLTVKPELNIGIYQKDINLVASMEFNERLALNIKVKGHKPDWSFNLGNYEFTANIIGQLSIGGVISTDPDDIVACFVGEECRGTANLKYFEEDGIFLCFMNIYSNTADEIMNFKVWDASSGDVYPDVSPEIIFEQNGVYGSVNNPLPINTTNNIGQTIDLPGGWSWVSFNIWSEEFNDLNKAFSNLEETEGDLIKSQELFADFSKESWKGSLRALDNETSYKFYIQKAQSLIMSGIKIASETVQTPIVSGWNWVGYPLQSQIALIDALSSLSPTENDIMKSQHEFAICNDKLRWIGSLEFMDPGKGYILYSQNPGTLQYPGGIPSKSVFIRNESLAELPNTEQNMCIVANAVIDNPELYEIVAYNENGRICGKGYPKILPDNNVLYFITINSVSPQIIKFRAKSPFGEYDANEIVGFSADNLLGDIKNPYKLTFRSQLYPDISVYPNPFTNKITVNLSLENTHNNVALRLFNILGEEIGIKQTKLPKGEYALDLLKELNLKKDLISGIYMLSVNIDDIKKVVKIVKR